ncbi:uncharacterized protein LOC102377766 isoform X2 [Alligator sinensis]|uniref:Uncharacterized protein LOC102377766 isoform X2 n=1 Tax=Alligator sinensis TaxID=38654 RepID=A0A1U7S541_ALLSI|nr:uncharacterized protein LOC102377766 isoform X2 [Alligator sinensis]
MELFKLSLSCICLLPWLQVSEGQSFLIKNIRLEKCIHITHHESIGIGLADCKLHSQQQQWSWDPSTKSIVSLKTKQCLTVHKPQDFALARLEPCGDREHQAWACSKKGHLTLQGLGLHLNTKQGSHKVFVSREKDKFSKWKTLTDEPICAVGLMAVPGLADPIQSTASGLLWPHETKIISSSPKTHVPSRAFPMESATPSLANNLNSTVSALESKPMHLKTKDEGHRGKQHGHRGKAAGPRQGGTNWKTAMLVLSPLAFILGLIILMLNVHYNKKKKILNALKPYPEDSSTADSKERSSCLGPAGTRQYDVPASRSPSLRHGEILIEWKDGTVTPLFDHAKYQID